MKKLVLLGLCVLFSLHAWAQSSLSGRIYDAKTTAPLVGASVWIESLGKGESRKSEFPTWATKPYASRWKFL